MKSFRQALLAVVLLWGVAESSQAQELDAVELDVRSGTVTRRLPFDVPFILAGEAPPGSVSVELTYLEKDEDASEFREPFHPAEPLVSRVGGDGRFRFRLGPFSPDRDFRFRLVFRRRLEVAQSARLTRSLDAILNRHLREATVDELGLAQASRLREELRDELLRSLGEGRSEPLEPDAISVTGSGSLFDDQVSEREARDALERLAANLLSREAERRESLRLLGETTPSFESDLDAIRRDPALGALLGALEESPDTDPRNPRNALQLSEEAYGVVRGSDAEIAALARGRRATDAGIDLASTLSVEDASRVRSRYIAAARALRDLRDWLQSLVAPGGASRDVVAALVASSALSSAEVSTLSRIASTDGGLLLRAERWAETLETYAYDLERALLSRERALEELRAELEASALSAEVEETVESDVLTTRANLYVGLDLGVLYSPEIERAAGYVGANVYFAPVNKSASLSQAGGLKKRLSVTFGITVTDIALEDDARIAPLFGSRSDLLLGLGYRFARSLRVGGGTLLVLKNDPNPLVTDRSLAFTPYFSFSFDVDLVGALRSLTR